MTDLHLVMHTPPDTHSRIAVVTLATPNIESYASITADINRMYCERYDLTFIKHTELLDHTRHPSWNKLLAVLEAMEADDGTQFDYVMWVDADATFANHSMNVRSLIAFASNTDFIIGLDPPSYSHSMCAGVWIVRNTPEMRDIVHDWYVEGGLSKYRTQLFEHPWEQLVLKESVFDRIPNTLVVPHYFFNHLPVKQRIGFAFMIHLMAMPEWFRVNLLKLLHETLKKL